MPTMLDIVDAVKRETTVKGAATVALTGLFSEIKKKVDEAPDAIPGLQDILNEIETHTEALATAIVEPTPAQATESSDLGTLNTVNATLTL